MSHPEDTCQRCGGNNIWSWNVPSDRFNVAMIALGLTSAAIVCPTCFVDGHELATGMRTVWTLQPDGAFWHIGNIEGERPPRGATLPGVNIDVAAAAMRQVSVQGLTADAVLTDSEMEALAEAAIAAALTPNE